MAIPTYEEAMLPVLVALDDGDPHHVRELTTIVADHFGLSADERAERLPSGRVTVVRSRCGWAITYLFQAKLIQRTSRGTYTITERGRDILANSKQSITSTDLLQFPEFVEFTSKAKASSVSVEFAPGPATIELPNEQTPEETIGNGVQRIRSALKQELLLRIQSTSPAFFERMVVDLLVAMGYGGDFGEAIQAMGQSGDGGIDGIIKEDKLGLDFVYVQAKRWQNTVQRPDVQQFAGSLMGRNASKGVFITTSAFSKGAKEYAQSISTRIVLVNGELLADLLIDHGVGVADEQVIRIQKLDEDYFDEV